MINCREKARELVSPTDAGRNLENKSRQPPINFAGAESPLLTHAHTHTQGGAHSIWPVDTHTPTHTHNTNPKQSSGESIRGATTRIDSVAPAGLVQVACSDREPSSERSSASPHPPPSTLDEARNGSPTDSGRWRSRRSACTPSAQTQDLKSSTLDRHQDKQGSSAARILTLAMIPSSLVVMRSFPSSPRPKASTKFLLCRI